MATARDCRQYGPIVETRNALDLHVFDECGHGEFFDSFGQYPARVFERYMNKYCSVWSYNNKQLQSLISRFCGHYVIWFSVFKARKYSLTELLRNVSSDTGLNDYLAHKFACTLIRS